MSTFSDVSNISTAKRKRGRAPGSKNKPKVPVAATSSPAAAALHSHVLQIPAGGDVAQTIAAFARGCRSFGVCVLSASGPIAAAVLWEASPLHSTLTFTGRFDLLSMTATFLPGGGGGSLAVTLAGPQGQVVGGVVAGPVVALAAVTVVAATYASPAFHCVDAMDNSPVSVLPGMGGLLEEGLGKSLSGQVDGSSVIGEGGGGENNYFSNLEQYLDLVGEDVGEAEVDGSKLEHYVNELEQCLELPAAVGAASSGGGGGTEEETEIDGESLFGGSNIGSNLFEQYSAFPTANERAFGSGGDVCGGDHFAFDAFRVRGIICPPLY